MQWINAFCDKVRDIKLTYLWGSPHIKYHESGIFFILPDLWSNLHNQPLFLHFNVNSTEQTHCKAAQNQIKSSVLKARAEHRDRWKSDLSPVLGRCKEDLCFGNSGVLRDGGRKKYVWRKGRGAREGNWLGWSHLYLCFSFQDSADENTYRTWTYKS